MLASSSCNRLHLYPGEMLLSVAISFVFYGISVCVELLLHCDSNLLNFQISKIYDPTFSSIWGPSSWHRQEACWIHNSKRLIKDAINFDILQNAFLGIQYNCPLCSLFSKWIGQKIYLIILISSKWKANFNSIIHRL